MQTCDAPAPCWGVSLATRRQPVTTDREFVLIAAAAFA
jgi:hypothetical protein